VAGDAVRGFLDSVEVISGTITDSNAHGYRAGLYVFGYNGDGGTTAYDNFACGDL
jgi:hypothetical protein